MFRLNLKFNPGPFERARRALQQAPTLIRQKIGTELTPALETELQKYLETPPGPVSSPFVFVSERSRLFWFALISEFPEFTDGAHYIRKGLIQSAWEVHSVATSAFMTRIVAYNRYPPARYLYGPRAVPGHVLTGWPSQFAQARYLVLRETRIRTVELVTEAWRLALRGGF